MKILLGKAEALPVSLEESARTVASVFWVSYRSAQQASRGQVHAVFRLPARVTSRPSGLYMPFYTLQAPRRPAGRVPE